MITALLEEMNESRTEKGRGSASGRAKGGSSNGSPKNVKARKSRVTVFPTIKKALQSASPFGTMFSTKGADRLYVISKKKWGTDRQSQVGSKIAKGFTPGSSTPGASFPSIKAHSIRTALRHGVTTSKTLKKKYGAGGSARETEKRYAGKKSVKPKLKDKDK